jgi:hypothetical protein
MTTYIISIVLVAVSVVTIYWLAGLLADYLGD